MANYSLVANSTFQPFTYQELAAPLDRMELYHEKLADEYDKLSSQADVLEAMGKNDKNSGAYSRYKAYSDSLRKEADDLYRFGLNTESRQRLSDLRRMYNTDIVPIQNAWTKRKEEADMQMKASMTNPSLMFTRDAANTSLDEYVANPTGGYGVINGANITAQMSAMAKNLEKQIRNGDTTLEKIDPYTYNHIRRFGLDANMIRDWRNSDTLKKMFSQVMQANGVTPEALQGSLNAQSIIDKSTGYAEMGMWSAMGEDKSQIIENYGARLEAQTQAKIAEEKAKKGDGVPDIPNWAEERAGIKTADGYIANAPDVIGELKAGNNSFKSSYFGKTMGDVNPLAVYEDYQEELKKRPARKTTYVPTGSGMTRVEGHQNTKGAKEATLAKYRNRGVTNIISKEQYDLLKGMGYDNKSSFRGVKYNDVESKLNNLATQYTRYSTKMSGYDLPDETIRTNILRMPDVQFKSGKLWEMKDDGSIGSTVTDKSDLNLKTNDNTKGTQVADIQYDPQHKGKILITFGDKRFIASPDIIDAQLTKALNRWEKDGYDPRIITGMISKWMNTYNKTQSKTDSKA